MKAGPCRKAERDLGAATRELAGAAEAATRLASRHPVGDLEARLKGQEELTGANKRLEIAEKGYRDARDALERCIEENPRLYT
jgi:hypothetical protein